MEPSEARWGAIAGSADLSAIGVIGLPPCYLSACRGYRSTALLLERLSGLSGVGADFNSMILRRIAIEPHRS